MTYFENEDDPLPWKTHAEREANISASYQYAEPKLGDGRQPVAFAFKDVWRFTDALGKPVKKTRWQRRLDKAEAERTGQHTVTGLTDREKSLLETTLYNAWRLADDPANYKSDRVQFCEGEKDAANLTAQGYLVVSSPNGACVNGKALSDAQTELMRDRPVTVHIDNDAAGEEHAATIAAQLSGIASDIRISRYTNLPEKSDVSDWLETGPTDDAIAAKCAGEEAYDGRPEIDTALDLDQIGIDPRHRRIFTGQEPYSKSDRTLAYFAANKIIDAGGGRPQVMRVLTNPEWPTSAHCRAKGETGAVVRASRLYDRIIAARGQDYFRKGRGNEIDPSHPYNIRKALGEIGVVLSFDSFSREAIIDGLDPKFTDRASGRTKINDETAGEIFLTIIEQCGFKPDVNVFRRALHSEARRSTFNPVCEMLDRAQAAWEATPEDDRASFLETWLIEFAGVEDTPLNRALSKMLLIAAVRRVRKPGTKFDNLLILESPQGWAKQKFLKALAVEEGWYTNATPIGADGKIVMELMQGKWIGEIAELNKFSQREIGSVKVFLDTTHDRGRLAYAEHTSEIGRAFVFVGTTNEDEYLSDPTGNRRFNPIRLGKEIDVEGFRGIVLSLWGEAAAAEAAGAPHELPSEFWETAAEEQKAREIENPLTDVIRFHFEAFEEGKVTRDDAFVVAGYADAGRRSPKIKKQLVEAMEIAGFAAGVIKIQGKAVRGFSKGEGYGKSWLSFHHNGSKLFVATFDEETGRPAV